MYVFSKLIHPLCSPLTASLLKSPLAGMSLHWTSDGLHVMLQWCDWPAPPGLWLCAGEFALWCSAFAPRLCSCTGASPPPAGPRRAGSPGSRTGCGTAPSRPAASTHTHTENVSFLVRRFSRSQVNSGAFFCVRSKVFGDQVSILKIW